MNKTAEYYLCALYCGNTFPFRDETSEAKEENSDNT